MNFKNFSRAQFSKLRNSINGVGEFRYGINRITGLEIVRGGSKLYTDTHTHTHRNTLTHRQTHTHTPRLIL